MKKVFYWIPLVSLSPNLNNAVPLMFFPLSLLTFPVHQLLISRNFINDLQP